MADGKESVTIEQLKQIINSSGELKDGAIITPKIADGAVTKEKLSEQVNSEFAQLGSTVQNLNDTNMAIFPNGKLNMANVSDGSVTEAKLSSDVATKINEAKRDADSAIGTINSMFDDSALKPTAIANQSVTEEKLSQSVQDKLNNSGGGNIVDMIYPVGSIYMSVAAANPSTLFGGTWEKIEGKFIMSSDSSYAAGTTGGSNDAVAVSHTHSASTSSSGSHTHSGKSDTDGSHTHSISGGSHNHTGSTGSAGSHTHPINYVWNAGKVGGSDWRMVIQGKDVGNYGVSSDAAHGVKNAGSHSHTVTVNTSSSHSHTMTSAGGHYHILTIDSAGSHTHTVDVSSSGVDGKNKNMPAFIAVNVWKRTA